jgi:ABC-type glycerol-3-phosphate transport system substrate-binding protein
MVNNNWYDENVPKATQNHYAAATGGVNYVIPNWVRMGTFGQWGGATGGNESWMINTNVHKAVGSPVLRTLEDLHDYAVAVRNARLTNRAGQPIIPVIFQPGEDRAAAGQYIVEIIFLAYGGINNGWPGYRSIYNGNYGCSFFDPIFRDAVMEANRWFREGLFPATMLSQSMNEFDEILIGGRGGLIYYDHSQEDNKNFRRILQEQDPGNSIEVVFYDTGSRKVLNLPGRGLDPLSIQHQAHGTLGWNTNVITKNAKNPGRIFELLTYLLTPQGSIDWILGPQGVLWDNLDSNGYPIMRRPANSLSAEEYQEIGLWKWDLLGHANNVDNAKFAANAGLPENQRAWVETMQQTLFSPNLRITDEFTNLDVDIDPTSELGIASELIYQKYLELLPQIITASSAAQASALFDQLAAFATANRIREIDAIQDRAWKNNCSLQNGSIYKW